MYVELLPGLVVGTGSAVLFSATLFAVLLVYIHEDVVEARLLLVGLAIANVALVLFSRLFSLHLASPLGFSVVEVPRELFAQDYRVMVVGTLTLLIDGVLLAVAYEVLCRLLPRMPLLRIYLALALVLTFDGWAFVTGVFFGRPDYFEILSANIVGKLFSSFFFALALGVAQRIYRRWLPEPESGGIARDEIFKLLTYRQRYRRLREAEAELNRTSERLDIALEAGAIGTWDWYPSEGRLMWDDRMCSIFRVSPSEFSGRPEEFFRRVHPDDRARIEAEAEEAADQDVVDTQYRIVDEDGRVRHIRDRARRYRDGTGAIVRMVGTCVDVTTQEEAQDRLRGLTEELRATNDELEEMSIRDPLTGARNRRGLARVLDRDLARAQRSGAALAAILIDCDDFKSINDRYGHAVGDAALVAVAEAVKVNIRRGDTLGRIGGDEFLVLLADTTLDAARGVAEKLRQAVSAKTPPALGERRLTVSLAVAALSDETRSLKEVIVRTQAALKASKAEGKNRVSVASEPAPRRTVTASAAERPVAGGTPHTVAHPIFTLPGQERVGFELLLRGPPGPEESPQAIFAAAAAEDRLELLDAEVARRHIDAARDAKLEGRIHFNVMPSTLRRPPEGFLAWLHDVAAVSPLCLELASQRLSGSSCEIPPELRDLQGSGVWIAIDGAGTHALEAISTHGPDLVKVERVAIGGVDRDGAQRESLGRFVDMVHGAGAQVAAVGVATASERRVLSDIGFDLAQGPLWSEESLHLGLQEASTRGSGVQDPDDR